MHSPLWSVLKSFSFIYLSICSFSFFFFNDLVCHLELSGFCGDIYYRMMIKFFYAKSFDCWMCFEPHIKRGNKWIQSYDLSVFVILCLKICLYHCPYLYTLGCFSSLQWNYIYIGKWYVPKNMYQYRWFNFK